MLYLLERARSQLLLTSEEEILSEIYDRYLTLHLKVCYYFENYEDLAFSLYWLKKKYRAVKGDKQRGDKTPYPLGSFDK